MNRITLALSAAALALAGGAIAATTPAKPMDPMGGKTITRAEAESHARTMFDKIDANHDGKLDKADREARELEHFKKMDTDGNGAISQAEFLAAHDRKPGGPGMGGGMNGPMGRGPDGPPPPEGMDHGRMGHGGKHRMGQGEHGSGMGGMMGRMADANKDGVVTRDEFVAGALAHFDKADANKDGKVTSEERRAAMKAMHEKMKAMRGKMGQHMGGMGAGMGDGPPPPPAH